MSLKKTGEKLSATLIVCSWVVAGLFYMVYLHTHKTARKGDHLCTIGILQTATHPALDAARQGFIDLIKERVGDKIDFVVRNGQGAIDNIHAIAQQFHAKNDIAAIFAIATPAAQAIASVEQAKPISIAAVSVSPALRSIFSQENICGTSDMINVRAEIEAIKLLLPEVKTVGIVYSTAEINAIAMAQIMVKELEAVGCMPLLIGVSSENEIEPALVSAVRKVDLLLAPTDNMVANAIALVIDIANRAGKPVVVSDNMLVQHGALMARGVDYYKSGQQSAALLLQVIIDGKKPSDLPIVPADNKEICVNQHVAQLYGVTIPDSIKDDIILV